jgi:hypothetical protein
MSARKLVTAATIRGQDKVRQLGFVRAPDEATVSVWDDGTVVVKTVGRVVLDEDESKAGRTLVEKVAAIGRLVDGLRSVVPPILQGSPIWVRRHGSTLMGKVVEVLDSGFAYSLSLAHRNEYARWEEEDVLWWREEPR